MEKRCPKCKNTKSTQEFYRDKRAKDGRRVYCKKCEDAAAKKWAQDNPEKVKITNKRNWEKNSKGYAEKRKATGLIYKFGITLDKYNELLALQGNCCAVCGEALGNDGHQPCVDHDHSKKSRESVRGIVHRRCNLLLGQVEKNPELFAKIGQYLERHGIDR